MAQQMTTKDAIQVSNTILPENIAHSKRKHAGNDGDAGRKRVSQACDQCRNKKLKCDGLRPTCSSCVSQERECLYGTALKKRGLPEGYVRGLERLLGFLMCQHEAESVASIFQDALHNKIAKEDLITQWNGQSVRGETLAAIWRSSRLSKALEQLLPELDAPHITGQDIKRPRLEPHTDKYRRERSNVAQMFLAKSLPPQDIAETLFHLYFGYTHCWLPFVGKDEILSTYYHTIELSESSLESGQHAVLWAVLACAASQRPATTSDQLHGAENLASESYYEKARSLIPSEDSGFQVGHVQALLLLTLVQLSLGHLSASWLLVGQASNLAIDLRLGKGDLSGNFNSRHRNVFLGCFCLDTLIATMLGRCPHLRKEDAAVLGPLDENGLEEWGRLDLADRQVGERPGPARTISIFNQLIRLVCILNDIVRDLPAGEDRENACRNYQSRLNEWKMSLPSHSTLNIDRSNPNSSSPLLPHQLNLHLTFVICITTLRSQFVAQPLSEAFSEYTPLLRQIFKQCTQVSFESGTGVLPAFFVLAGLVLKLDEGNLDLLKGMDWRAYWPQISSYVDDIWPSRDAIGSGISLKHVPDAHDSLELYSSQSAAINIAANRTSSLVECSGRSTSPASSKIPKGYEFSHTGILLPSQVDVVIVNEPNPQQDPDFNSADRILTTDPTNWGVSLNHNTTLAPLGISKAVQGAGEGDLSWFNKDPSPYSAASDLFDFAQSSRSSQLPIQSHIDGEGLDSLHSALSIPDMVPGSIKEFTLEPALQSMMFTDDLFLELSNLDYFAGDRDETYRNLGFLLPQQDSDPFALPSHPGNNSSSNY